LYRYKLGIRPNQTGLSPYLSITGFFIIGAAFSLLFFIVMCYRPNQRSQVEGMILTGKVT